MVSFILTGCAMVGEDYSKPTLRSTQMAGWNGRLDGAISNSELDPKVLAEWWTTFNDETLTSLIERASLANLELRIAKAQLRRARAERNVAEAAKSAQVTFGGSAQQNSNSGSSSQLYKANLDASWELDIFGGIARDIEASDADLQAAEEARRDVLVSVLAEVALNYNDLLSLQRRKLVAQENLAAQQDYLKIVLAQQRAGTAIQLDVDQATANVENTRSEIPSLDQQAHQVKNRLAVILGQSPGSLNNELSHIKPLSVPSEKIAVGVPAEVLRRRPDVRKAERTLAAATARVGVAKADLYPKFALRGSIGIESLSPSGLLTSIGPGVQHTIFDGGRIREKIEIQSALQEEALIQYESTMLNALEDVQNAITAFSQEQLRYRSLKNSAESSLRTTKLAESRYSAGDTNFLNVLDAQRTQFGVQDKLVQSEAQILGNLIRLYKALGGGWTPESTVGDNG